MEIKITSEYIDDACGYVGRSLVGKLLKRMEIVEDRTVLKALTKEMVYEELRHLRDLFLAANPQSQITQFQFKK